MNRSRSFLVSCTAALAALCAAGSASAQYDPRGCCSGYPTAVECVTNWNPASEIAYPHCHDEYLDYTDRGGDDTFIAQIMQSFECRSGDPCFWYTLNYDWSDVCVSYENLNKQKWADYILCLIHDHPDVFPSIGCTDPSVNWTCIPDPKAPISPGVLNPIYITPTGTPFDPENIFKPSIIPPLDNPPVDWDISTPSMLVPWPIQKYIIDARAEWFTAVDYVTITSLPLEGTKAYPAAVVASAFDAYDSNMLTIEAQMDTDMKARNVGNSLPAGIADWNADAGVDGDDVTAFYTDWGNGVADVNFDGSTDGSDVTAFFACWDESACY